MRAVVKRTCQATPHALLDSHSHDYTAIPVGSVALEGVQRKPSAVIGDNSSERYGRHHVSLPLWSGKSTIQLGLWLWSHNPKHIGLLIHERGKPEKDKYNITYAGDHSTVFTSKIRCYY